MIKSYSTSIDEKTRCHFLEQKGDGEVIGSMAVELDSTGETGFLYDLYVNPENRRRGIASELIKAAIDDLGNAEKTSSFTCKIKNKNTDSKALFTKLGFRKSLDYDEDNSFYYTLFV